MPKARHYGKEKGRGVPARLAAFFSSLFAPAKLMLLCYYAGAFLAAKTAVFGVIFPFGAAFFAAEYADKLPWAAAALALLGAFLAGARSLALLKYAAAIIFFSVLCAKLGAVVKKNLLRRSIWMAFCLILSGLLLMVGTRPYLYDILMLLLEALICVGGAFIFANASFAVLDVGGGELSGEGLVFLSAYFGLAAMGLGGFVHFFGISPGNILAVLIVMLFAFTRGVMPAAAAGVIMGVIAGFEGGNLTGVLGAYAFAALLAGIFSQYGKIGVVSAFILGNSLVTYYTNGSSEVLINIYEIILAGLLLFALPEKAAQMICKNDAPSRADRLRGILEHKLRHAGGAFNLLSKTFGALAEKKVEAASAEAALLFERTARECCEGCSMIPVCWKNEFGKTYAAFMEMLDVAEKKGRLSPGQMPATLSVHCRRVQELCRVFNSMYELCKADRIWRARIEECRCIISGQLDGIGRILAKMGRELPKISAADRRAESEIRAGLTRLGIGVKSVFITDEGRGRQGISLALKSCGGFRQCEMQVPAVIKEVMGEGFEPVGKPECGECTLKFAEPERFKVCIGVAECAGGGKNGDSHGYMRLDGGRYAVVLSDGMGRGQKAADTSGAAVELLQKLLGAGFSTDTAVALVNSVLVTKSSETSFSTIDLAIIDLRRGRAEFVKIGAAASFIKKGDGVDIIHSSSLPAGLFQKVDIELSHMTMGAGDMLVMVSDGVLDSNRAAVKKENWFCAALSKLDGQSPDKLAGALVELAKKNYNDAAADDMTVIAVEIKECI